MGTIIAIGGGENGRPGTIYETESIDREIIKISGKSKPVFLFIGLAVKNAETYYSIMQNIYSGYGCEIDHLTFDDITCFKTASNKINSADIIYVGGGNTLRLMTLFRKYGIDKLLLDAYQKDKILCGLSAGAIYWCAYGNSDSRKFTSGSDEFIKVKGLGLVNVLLCPHYENI